MGIGGTYRLIIRALVKEQVSRRVSPDGVMPRARAIVTNEFSLSPLEGPTRPGWQARVCFRHTVTDPGMATKLSDIEIQRALNSRSGWTRRGNALTRTFELPTFPAVIAFVNRVAAVAEKMDHHPDIDIRYTKVSFSLSTHSAGGITQKDFKLSEEIDSVVTGD